jgi:hypothetical protein
MLTRGARMPVGLVASLARPGGNLTGVNFLTAELTAKRLLLLRELMPSADRVGVLVNPGNVAATETILRTCGAPCNVMNFAPAHFGKRPVTPFSEITATLPLRAK